METKKIINQDIKKEELKFSIIEIFSEDKWEEHEIIPVLI